MNLEIPSQKTPSIRRLLKRSILATSISVLLGAAPQGSAASHSEAPKLESAENFGIRIPRDEMGKEYLISASMIPQAGAPTSQGLAGKIVHFELYHDGVDLYESTDGLVVTKDLPARRLITTFPIIDSDESSVVIDFNAGMRRVFTAIWYSTGYFAMSSRDDALEVTRSRVFDVKSKGDRLVVRQIVQARSRESSENNESQQEIRYFIQPRHASDFEGKEHDAQVEPHLRFFQIQPLLEPTTGRRTKKIARYDISEPITFYFSANTPDDYVQPVKDGILYWNKVFGREIVKAARAPEGVTAPDATHNLVQWVPWDNAGFAYADILVDPRTGQSRRGQAYMTSVFAIGGKARARVILRAMRAQAEKARDGDDSEEENHESHERFWPLSSVCMTDPAEFADHVADGLQELLSNDDLTDEAILRFSQDYVLNTVAHEVGHVLGLRHNFAGSLASNMTHNELNEWLEDYVLDEDLEQWHSKRTTSSVMEYQPLKARAFSGFLMRSRGEPLPHDKAAIHWGYYDDQEAIEKNMFFGTDSEVSRWGDVNRFDYGPDPVVSAYADLAEQIIDLPYGIIEQFIRAKAPKDPRDAIPLETLVFSPSSSARQLAANLSTLLSWFRSDIRALKVEREFDYVGPLNQDERVKAHWERLNEQIKALGGIDRAVFSTLPVTLNLKLGQDPKGVPVATKISAKELTASLKAALESPAYAEFVGLDGETYSFSDEEKDLIIERGRTLFNELEEEYLNRTLEILGSTQRDIGREATGTVGQDDIISELEQRIIELAEHTLTQMSEDDYIKGKINESRVEILDFKYSEETRRAAAQSLANNNGSFSNWSKEAKGEIRKKIEAKIDSMLNISNFKEFKDTMLSRPLRDWYLRQQDILRLLPATG